MIFFAMKSLVKKYKIQATPEKVWKALTDKTIIEQWSGSRCVMSEKEGSDFSLWDGDIWGKNIEVVPGKKLVQEWYSGKWQDPSIVEFEIHKEGSDTILNMYHRQIPDGEFDGINSGWDDYYLEPLKVICEGIR